MVNYILVMGDVVFSFSLFALGSSMDSDEIVGLLESNYPALILFCPGRVLLRFSVEKA